MVAASDHPRLADPGVTSTAAPKTEPDRARLWRVRLLLSVRLCRVQDYRATSNAAPNTVPSGPTVEGATAEDVTAAAWTSLERLQQRLRQCGVVHISPTRVNLYSSEQPPSLLILLEMGLGRCRRVYEDNPTLGLAKIEERHRTTTGARWLLVSSCTG